MIRSLVTLAL